MIVQTFVEFDDYAPQTRWHTISWAPSPVYGKFAVGGLFYPVVSSDMYMYSSMSWGHLCRSCTNSVKIF